MKEARACDHLRDREQNQSDSQPDLARREPGELRFCAFSAGCRRIEVVINQHRIPLAEPERIGVLARIPNARDLHRVCGFVDSVKDEESRSVQDTPISRALRHGQTAPRQHGERQCIIDQRITEPLGGNHILTGEEADDLLQVALGAGCEDYAVVQALIFWRTSSAGTAGSLSKERIPSSSAASIAGVLVGINRAASQSATSRICAGVSLSKADSISITVDMGGRLRCVLSLASRRICGIRVKAKVICQMAASLCRASSVY